MTHPPMSYVYDAINALLRFSPIRGAGAYALGFSDVPDCIKQKECPFCGAKFDRTVDVLFHLRRTAACSKKLAELAYEAAEEFWELKKRLRKKYVGSRSEHYCLDLGAEELCSDKKLALWIAAGWLRRKQDPEKITLEIVEKHKEKKAFAMGKGKQGKISVVVVVPKKWAELVGISPGKEVEAWLAKVEGKDKYVVVFSAKGSPGDEAHPAEGDPLCPSTC